MNTELRIPCSENGDQLGYVYGHMNRYFKNHIFEDVLLLDSYEKGRSRIRFWFIRESNGQRVSMFLSEFMRIGQGATNAKVGMHTNGKLAIAGTFSWTKRGTSYGVLATEPEPVTVVSE
jgi:hypothetical protein